MPPAHRLTESVRPSKGMPLVHPKMPSGSGGSTRFHCAPQPNCGFNADANIGHAFGIFMAYVGTLRTSCSGAG